MIKCDQAGAHYSEYLWRNGKRPLVTLKLRLTLQFLFHEKFRSATSLHRLKIEVHRLKMLDPLADDLGAGMIGPNFERFLKVGYRFVKLPHHAEQIPAHDVGFHEGRIKLYRVVKISHGFIDL